MALFRNRKRTTIADVKAEAMGTMSDAKETLALAKVLIGLAEVLVDRLANGVTVTAVKLPGMKLFWLVWKFFTSEEKVSFPIRLQVELSEEPEE